MTGDERLMNREKKRGVLFSLLALSRLGNGLVASAAVLLGLFFAKGSLTLNTVAGMIAYLLLVSAGNADNDLLDLETDRINQPARPLPSGALSTKTAALFAAGTTAAALLLGWLASLEQFALLLAAALLLFLYNRRLKNFPRAGNYTVALLSASPLLWHSWPHPDRAQWAAALVALLLTSLRELIKDFEDRSGDIAAGRRSLPITAGERAAVQTLAMRFSASYGAAIAVPLIASWSLLPAVRYWCALLLLATPLLISALLLAKKALHSPAEEQRTHWSESQKRIKWAMVAGMGALFLATF